MGSKNLKAVVAAGDGRPPIHDRASLLALRKELNGRLHQSKIIEYLGRLGTPMLYENSNRLGAIRTKNGQVNQWSSALDARHIEEHVSKMVSCAGCTVLDGQAALHGIGDAGELRQPAVACGVDDTPAELARQRLDDLSAHGSQTVDRADLVALHLARVAHHVRHDDGREPARKFLRHVLVLPRRAGSRESVSALPRRPASVLR